MTTFYLDPVGGSDAADGTSFANRWKTMTSGATAARIAPGDVIRIIKSLDPTSLGIDATWTNFSGTVTLASALTQSIYLDGAWTASANVTCTASGTAKQGSNSSSIALAAGFTTGLAAYFATGTLDLSGYQQLSFYIRQSSGTLHSVSGRVQLALCSDTVGATPVDTFDVPALDATGVWARFTIDKGSALGSAIASIAFYVTSDQGAQTFLIDNVLGVKDDASADSLSLTSLIGKDDGTGWWPIVSINGTAVVLEYDSGSSTPALYTGTTETVETFKRESTLVPLSATNTTFGTVTDSGTEGSPITYSGGWNATDMSTQTGESYLDFNTGRQVLTLSSRSYINLDTIGLVRTGNMSVSSLVVVQFNLEEWVSGGTVAVVDGNSQDCLFDFGELLTCGTLAGNSAAWGTRFVADNVSCLNALEPSGRNTSVTIGNMNNCGGNNVLSFNGMAGANISISGVCDGLQRLFSTNTAGHEGVVVNCEGLTVGSNLTAVLGTGFLSNVAGCSVVTFNGGDFGSKTITFSNATALGTPRISFNRPISHGAASFTSTVNAELRFTEHDGTADDHRTYMRAGTIFSETSVRHTASGLAWKLSPTSVTLATDTAPLKMSVARVAVASAGQVDVSAWLRRTNTGLTAALYVPGGQLAGVSEATEPMTAAADTWEQVTLSVTPSEAGVIEVFVIAYGGTTYSGYIDDLTVTQA